MTDDWIDIKDQDVPKDGSWFVIWIPGAMPEVGRYEPEQEGQYVYHFDNYDNATHWKPLKPPVRYMTANEFKSCLNVVKQDSSIVPYLDQEPDTGETGA